MIDFVPYDYVVRNSSEGVLICNNPGNWQIAFLNSAATGAQAGQVIALRYREPAVLEGIAGLKPGEPPVKFQAEIRLTENRIVQREITIFRPLQPDVLVIYERDLTEQRKLLQQLNSLVLVDPHTGLLKRQALLEMLEREWRRAKRYAERLSLIVLDLDHFHELNARYGERTGDLVLQFTARECQFSLREQDIVGRLDGDEFGILLPETEADGGFEAANRIRQAVSQMQFPVVNEVARTTLSAGVSQIRSDDLTSDAMYLRAYAALQNAKDQGGNCVRG